MFIKSLWTSDEKRFHRVHAGHSQGQFNPFENVNLHYLTIWRITSDEGF